MISSVDFMRMLVAPDVPLRSIRELAVMIKRQGVQPGMNKTRRFFRGNVQLSKGNVTLSKGFELTEADYESKKDRVLKHDYCA